jgi:hypothetical protein
MPLSDKSKALLDACAAAAVAGDRNASVDLYPLNPEFSSMSDEMTQYLTGAIESASNGQLTVRTADPALFASRVRGPNLYLVVCDSNTPKGEVTEFLGGMQLLGVGPYNNGLKVDDWRRGENPHSALSKL